MFLCKSTTDPLIIWSWEKGFWTVLSPSRFVCLPVWFRMKMPWSWHFHRTDCHETGSTHRHRRPHSYRIDCHDICSKHLCFPPTLNCNNFSDPLSSTNDIIRPQFVCVRLLICDQILSAKTNDITPALAALCLFVTSLCCISIVIASILICWH